MPPNAPTNRHQHAAGQRCSVCNQQRTDPGLQPPLIDGPGGKGEAPQGKPAPGQGTRLSMEQLPPDLIAAFQTVIDYATGVKALPSTGAPPPPPTPPMEGEAALPPVPPQPEEEPNAPQPPPMDSGLPPKDDEAARARANRAAAEQINRNLGI